jgi:hypothetical protein
MVQVAAAPRTAGQRAAREQLRRQIAALEGQLAGQLAVAQPAPSPLAGAPRILDLGELERVRDELARRLAAARAVAEERAQRVQSDRRLLEAMLRDPRRHKFVRVRNPDLCPGVCAWHVRPRLGLIGMLMGWWQVKISSGCPLPAALPRGRSR